MDKSKKEDISWDLFLAPHHCSWSYFNDHSDEGKKQPQESSLEILDKGIGKSPKIIISSKPIEDNDDNPPSYQAKMEYVKKCSEKNIFITATHSQSETPKPIEFRITDSGPQERTTDKSEKASKLAVSNVVKQPKTYGK